MHKVDEEFIKEASNSSVQPLGKISAGIIKAKELGEKVGLLNTSTFSGLGVNFKTKDGRNISFTKKQKKIDPTERLKKLAGMGICKPKPKSKKQKGGIAPLGIAILASLAGTALGKVWDLVKEKLQSGHGYTIDDNMFKSDAHKRRLLHHILI